MSAIAKVTNDWEMMEERTREYADAKGMVVVCFTDRNPKLTPKGAALHFIEPQGHNVFVPLSNCYRIKGDGKYQWEVAMPKWLASKMRMI